MATCSSFQEIFEKPLPENPTLIESLASSWKQMKAKKEAELNSFTEIFGELHFKEINPPDLFSSSSSSMTTMDVNLQPGIEKHNDISSNEKKTENKETPSLNSLLGTPKNQYTSSANNGKKGFSAKKPENLKLCTEGLGFESSDEVENSKYQSGDDWKDHGKEKVSLEKVSPEKDLKNPSSDDLSHEFKRMKSPRRDFPPPISCIGRNGKPRVCLRSYRYDGRFVLKEIQIPTMEILHACREDGRLKLHLVIPDKKIPEEEEGEGEDLEEVEDENEDQEERENDDADADADEQKENEKGEEEKMYEFSKDEVEGNP